MGCEGNFLIYFSIIKNRWGNAGREKLLGWAKINKNREGKLKWDWDGNSKAKSRPHWNVKRKIS